MTNSSNENLVYISFRLIDTSYLSFRKQAIACDIGLTDFADVHSGVTQGSILGPTLFHGW